MSETETRQSNISLKVRDWPAGIAVRKASLKPGSDVMLRIARMIAADLNEVGQGEGVIVLDISVAVYATVAVPGQNAKESA